MKDFISDTGSLTKLKLSNLDPENKSIWTSIKIQQLLDDFENGVIDIKTIKNSPFKDNDPVWRKSNIVFEYTPEEFDEIKKCKADPLYFANTYAHVMTDDGVLQVELRDYQEEIIQAFKANRFNCLMASRQIGKTVMSAVFIAWYLIFHTDKNVLAVANVASTTKEVLEKIKSVIENLPFFLKPGCISNNVMSMKFDNNCRLIGRTTTKNTGIGFTIHILYIDEFAHINPSYLNFFYRAIYPTIEASKKSKVIITSTPNGMNRFHDIYMDAVNGKNGYVPLRVDWWQVEGRDEEWKKLTIANLGSEEDFNQEYGLQFFSSDKLLLPSKDLQTLFKLKVPYVIPDWAQSPDNINILDGFSVHPNFNRFTPDDIKNDGNTYIFSIDTASGVGRDYSVINIFKLALLPVNMLEGIKEFIKNEGDLFGLIQVATFRSNKKDINEFTNTLEHLMYNIFNSEKVKLLIELDHKGDYVLDKLGQNEDFWQGQVIHSKHTVSSTNWKPGLRMTETNKTKYCERFKYITAVHKIIPTEFKTVIELGSFGKTSNGNYRSQHGNDDLAITCIFTSAFFESPNFWELVNEELDRIPKPVLMELYSKFLNQTYIDQTNGYDYSALRELNKTPYINVPSATRQVDQSSIDNYKQLITTFYGASQLENNNSR